MAESATKRGAREGSYSRNALQNQIARQIGIHMTSVQTTSVEISQLITFTPSQHLVQCSSDEMPSVVETTDDNE